MIYIYIIVYIYIFIFFIFIFIYIYTHIHTHFCWSFPKTQENSEGLGSGFEWMCFALGSQTQIHLRTSWQVVFALLKRNRRSARRHGLRWTNIRIDWITCRLYTKPQTHWRKTHIQRLRRRQQQVPRQHGRVAPCSGGFFWNVLNALRKCWENTSLI